VNESRRRILAAAFWSGLSSLLTLKWLQAAPTADTTKVTPELAAKIAEAPNYDVDEVLMVAMGGTLPNQRNTCYVPGADLKIRHLSDEQHKMAWISTGPPPGEEWDEKLYPRLSGYGVTPEVLLGTIDEICEDFKQKLIAARQTIRSVNTPGLNECFGYCPEHQVTLKALRDQYKGSNPAAALPVDHAGMVRKVLEMQAERDKQAPSQFLPLTKPQMVWLCNHKPGAALLFMAYGVEHVWIAERDSRRTKLKWSVVISDNEPNLSDFDRDEQGLCLVLDSPNPWHDPEHMSKDVYVTPTKDYNEAVTEMLQKVGWTKENGY
jgi:hypothetical protein